MHKTSSLKVKELFKLIIFVKFRRIFLSKYERHVVQCSLYMLTPLQDFALLDLGLVSRGVCTCVLCLSYHFLSPQLFGYSEISSSRTLPICDQSSPTSTLSPFQGISHLHKKALLTFLFWIALFPVKLPTAHSPQQ